jgi:glyoxylase-like metal-dependent hydrolase (beta-lactamase superfamily II)
MAELFFKQLLAGRDIGRGDPIATQMQNFVYLIGDKESGECVVVDPAWAVDDVVDLVEEEDMKLVGALATHYHPDHVGGTMYGLTVEGLPRLMERAPCKVHAHKLEVAGIRQVTGLEESDFVKHDSGDKVKVGDIEIELLHTPGHTPGSLCFRLKSALVAGDTLFLQGCGRVDLPGGDPEQMYHTLTQRLSSLPGDTVLYPGHAYGGEHADLDTVRRTNQYMSIPNLETWMRTMG